MLVIFGVWVIQVALSKMVREGQILFLKDWIAFVVLMVGIF